MLWNRDAIGSQSDLLTIFCRDLGVNVQLGPAIGAEVEIVHTLDRSCQLRTDNRSLEIEIDPCPLGCWRRLARQQSIRRSPVLDDPRDQHGVLIDQLSRHVYLSLSGIRCFDVRLGCIKRTHACPLS